MTNTKHLRAESEVLSCRHVRTDVPDGSSPLTARGHSQLLADDFIPGSHLEVGDLEKRWICPSGRLEGTPVTSRPETRKRRASVGRDKAGDLNPNRLMA